MAGNLKHWLWASSGAALLFLATTCQSGPTANVDGDEFRVTGTIETREVQSGNLRIRILDRDVPCGGAAIFVLDETTEVSRRLPDGTDSAANAEDLVPGVTVVATGTGPRTSACVPSIRAATVTIIVP